MVSNEVSNIIATLGEVSNVIKGHSFRGKIEEIKNGNVLVVNAKNVNDLSGINYLELKRTTLEKTKRAEELMVREGDILCVSTGPRLYSCVAREVSEPVIPTTHLTLIRAQKQSILPEYLSWFINNSQKYYLLNAQGATIRNISIATLKSLPLNVPSIKEQQKIIDMDNLLKEEEMLMEKLLKNRKTVVGEIQKLLSTGQIRITN